MNKSELKAFVKRHFNLTETESFSNATLEDGTKVTNDQDGDFAVGQELFVIDEAGEKVSAPEGEHITKSGIQLIADAEGKLTGVKYPDAEGEGSADMAEIPAGEIDVDINDDKAEAMAKDDKEEKLEEEVEINMMDDEKPIEAVLEIISEVVEEKIEEMKKKMYTIEEELKDIKEKMSKFAAEPADEKTLPNRKFSKKADYKMSKVSEKRYNNMLKKLN